MTKISIYISLEKIFIIKLWKEKIKLYKLFKLLFSFFRDYLSYELSNCEILIGEFSHPITLTDLILTINFVVKIINCMFVQEKMYKTSSFVLFAFTYLI